MCICCEAGGSDLPGCLRNTEASGPSRRKFMKTSAGFTLGAAISSVAPRSAFAQVSRDSIDLDRLQGSSRILIRSAVVISMDKQVGDFADADVLIEGDKIREVRPHIA